MNADAKKKLTVVLLAALVFVPIIIWRSARAVDSAGLGSDSRDWNAFMKVTTERTAPSWYQPKKAYRLEAEPSGPHLKLGLIRFEQPAKSAKRLLATSEYYGPVAQRARELGANSYVIESVDENVPGLAEGKAEVVHVLYLEHAGVVPPGWRGGASQFCQATRILPSSIAERAGMKAGDVFIEVDGKNVVRAGVDDPCEPYLAELLKVPDGAQTAVRVIRNGEEVVIRMTRQGPQFGYQYATVPLLDAP